MASTRVPRIELTGPMGMMIKLFTKRMLGEVPDALGVMWHNPPVLKASIGHSRKASRWNKCDKHLKTYAHMAVASLIGCNFCLDLGYFQSRHEGLDEAKFREIPRWRESDAFTPLERDVMAYAEAMSQTPLTVTDEQSARLLEQLGAPAMIELTAFIAMSNQMTRTNVALGIRSQEYATACGLPPLAQPRGTVSSG